MVLPAHVTWRPWPCLSSAVYQEGAQSPQWPGGPASHLHVGVADVTPTLVLQNRAPSPSQRRERMGTVTCPLSHSGTRTRHCGPKATCGVAPRGGSSWPSLMAPACPVTPVPWIPHLENEKTVAVPRLKDSAHSASPGGPLQLPCLRRPVSCCTLTHPQAGWRPGQWQLCSTGSFRTQVLPILLRDCPPGMSLVQVPVGTELLLYPGSSRKKLRVYVTEGKNPPAEGGPVLSAKTRPNFGDVKMCRHETWS